MSINSNADEDLQLRPSTENGPNNHGAAIEPHLMADTGEISIGYIKNRRSYLDKQAKVGSTEAQVRALQEYHHVHFTAMERFVAHWILCQKATIQVGELGTATAEALQDQQFPREVHFESVQENKALSAGLLRPETLQDGGRLFHESTAFDINCEGKRKVLCIVYVVDKKRLVWPVLISFGIAFVSAAVTGVVTHNLGPSVSLGAFVGLVFASIWSFVMWLLG